MCVKTSKKMIRITNTCQSIIYPGILTPSVDYLECNHKIEQLLDEKCEILEVAIDGSTRSINMSNIDSLWVDIATDSIELILGGEAQIEYKLISGSGELEFVSDNNSINVDSLGKINATDIVTGNISIMSGGIIYKIIPVSVISDTSIYTMNIDDSLKTVGKNK